MLRLFRSSKPAGLTGHSNKPPSSIQIDLNKRVQKKQKLLSKAHASSNKKSKKGKKKGNKLWKGKKRSKSKIQDRELSKQNHVESDEATANTSEMTASLVSSRTGLSSIKSGRTNMSASVSSLKQTDSINSSSHGESSSTTQKSSPKPQHQRLSTELEHEIESQHNLSVKGKSNVDLNITREISHDHVKQQRSPAVDKGKGNAKNSIHSTSKSKKKPKRPRALSPQSDRSADSRSTFSASSVISPHASLKDLMKVKYYMKRELDSAEEKLTRHEDRIPLTVIVDQHPHSIVRNEPRDESTQAEENIHHYKAQGPVDVDDFYEETPKTSRSLLPKEALIKSTFTSDKTNLNAPLQPEVEIPITQSEENIQEKKLAPTDGMTRDQSPKLIPNERKASQSLLTKKKSTPPIDQNSSSENKDDESVLKTSNGNKSTRNDIFESAATSHSSAANTKLKSTFSISSKGEISQSIATQDSEKKLMKERRIALAGSDENVIKQKLISNPESNDVKALGGHHHVTLNQDVIKGQGAERRKNELDALLSSINDIEKELLIKDVESETGDKSNEFIMITNLQLVEIKTNESEGSSYATKSSSSSFADYSSEHSSIKLRTELEIEEKVSRASVMMKKSDNEKPLSLENFFESDFEDFEELRKNSFDEELSILDSLIADNISVEENRKESGRVDSPWIPNNLLQSLKSSSAGSSSSSLDLDFENFMNECDEEDEFYKSLQSSTYEITTISEGDEEESDMSTVLSREKRFTNQTITTGTSRTDSPAVKSLDSPTTSVKNQQHKEYSSTLSPLKDTTSDESEENCRGVKRQVSWKEQPEVWCYKPIDEDNTLTGKSVGEPSISDPLSEIHISVPARQSDTHSSVMNDSKATPLHVNTSLEDEDISSESDVHISTSSSSGSITSQTSFYSYSSEASESVKYMVNKLKDETNRKKRKQRVRIGLIQTSLQSASIPVSSGK